MDAKRKIYILHGWAYSSEKWKPLISELISDKLKVEMLKIPGLTAPLDKVWDIDDYVEWLRKILEEEAADIILVGHSNGGLIALAYCVKYSNRVSKLFLIDTTGIYHKELPLRVKRYVLGSVAKFGKMVTDSPRMKKLLYRIAGAHDYENASVMGRQTMRNLIRVDLQEKLSKIKIPTVIIWGSRDQVTPAKDSKIFSEKIENSKLYVIPTARHSPQITNYKEVAEIIQKNL